MAADLHIIIAGEQITEEVLAVFFSSTFGSKYFNPGNLQPTRSDSDRYFELVSEAPQIWIGEVSWLKASLFGEAEEFIPRTVGTISELIGEDLPVLDDELIGKILAAFDLPNATSYSLNEKEKVAEWLEQYKGQKVFTCSW